MAKNPDIQNLTPNAQRLTPIRQPDRLAGAIAGFIIGSVVGGVLGVTLGRFTPESVFPDAYQGYPRNAAFRLMLVGVPWIVGGVLGAVRGALGGKRR